MQRDFKLILNYFFLFFLALPIYAFPEKAAILVKCLRYAGFFWSVWVYIANRYYSSKAMNLIMLLLASMTLSTVLNRNGYSIMLSLIYNIFSASVLTMNIVSRAKYRGIASITSMLTILIIGQAVSFLIGGFGEIVDTNRMVNTQYFFGIRVEFNNVYIYTVSLMLIMWHSWKKRNRLLWLIGIASGGLFIVGEWVSTAIFTTMVLCMVLVVRKYIKNMTFWRIIGLLGIGIIMLFYVKGGNASLLKGMIEKVLKKDITFSGRIYIWEQAIDYMKGWHWIFGNGLNSGMLFYLGSNWTADTAHSQYLNLLFYFGVPSLLLYTATLLYQFRRASRIKKEKSKRIITATLIAIIVMGVSTTTFRNVYMYIYYIIVCMLPKIERDNSIVIQNVI